MQPTPGGTGSPQNTVAPPLDLMTASCSELSEYFLENNTMKLTSPLTIPADCSLDLGTFSSASKVIVEAGAELSARSFVLESQGSLIAKGTASNPIQLRLTGTACSMGGSSFSSGKRSVTLTNVTIESRAGAAACNAGAVFFPEAFDLSLDSVQFRNFSVPILNNFSPSVHKLSKVKFENIPIPLSIGLDQLGSLPTALEMVQIQGVDILGTWKESKSVVIKDRGFPYLVRQSIIIPAKPGVGLTIDPGVTMKFAPGRSISFSFDTSGDALPSLRIGAAGAAKKTYLTTIASNPKTDEYWGGIHISDAFSTVDIRNTVLSFANTNSFSSASCGNVRGGCIEINMSSDNDITQRRLDIHDSSFSSCKMAGISAYTSGDIFSPSKPVLISITNNSFQGQGISFYPITEPFSFSRMPAEATSNNQASGMICQGGRL
jgi:hypothetical protein